MKYTSLIDYRNEKNLTQREMAKAIGCSTSYYSKVELELVLPSYNFISKFKDAFPDFDIDIFFKKPNDD